MDMGETRSIYPAPDPAEFIVPSSSPMESTPCHSTPPSSFQQHETISSHLCSPFQSPTSRRKTQMFMSGQSRCNVDQVSSFPIVKEMDTRAIFLSADMSPSRTLPAVMNGNTEQHTEIENTPTYTYRDSARISNAATSPPVVPSKLSLGYETCTPSNTFRHQDGAQHRSPSKRPRITSPSSSPYKPPAPKRSTLLSQKLQHQKLSTPFRSPLMTKPLTINTNTPADDILPSPDLKGKGKDPVHYTPSRLTPRPISVSTPNCISTPQISALPQKLFGSSTSKASSPFKSPFTGKLTSAETPSAVQSVLTPNAQTLERKLQLLRRAVKIKKEGDEEKLTKLVQKWRCAGREVAWEVWNIVKEQAQEDTGTFTQPKSSFKDSWGWNDQASDRKADSWGWASSEPGQTQDDEDLASFTPPSPRKLEEELYKSLRRKPAVARKSMLPPTPRGSYYTNQMVTVDDDSLRDDDIQDVGGTEEVVQKEQNLGTMLHKLGIAHETLGWNDEEGDFLES
ncbi:hypothetical protein BD410DRAFT_779609 [Rickenella mellea]|uniref:Swi5-dependent recombination DNA repair protein 1 n=1 Tax=Rickenella mellea TaxID=50990 RepID=A0A4R5XGH2_9AGAM|nr:hypothetical protein BD410DRAFT_779609 [Rickenella mellea]